MLTSISFIVLVPDVLIITSLHNKCHLASTAKQTRNKKSCILHLRKLFAVFFESIAFLLQSVADLQLCL